MKILVPVKSVLDYNAKIKVNAAGDAIEKEGIKQIVNPFDEIAVEEAVKLKEAGKASEVTVISVGAEESVTQLRYAMAMGADQAILVKSSTEVDSDLAARSIAKIFERNAYDLILIGKQAIDSDAGQTPQLLAAYLDLPHASFASEVTIDGENVKVVREVDGGLETVTFTKPGIVSTDLRLNEPRYAPLPGIMKAKKKPLEEIDIAELGIAIELKISVSKLYNPEERQAGKVVDNVDQLVELLRNEAKVL